MAKVLELQRQSFQWIFRVHFLGITGLILQSKGLSRVISSTTVRKHQFFGAQPSLRPISHICTQLLEKRYFQLYGPLSAKWYLCFLNTLSRFVIAFLLRSNYILISWLQSPFTVILEPKKRKFVTASIFPPGIGHEVMGPDAMILVFLLLSFPCWVLTDNYPYPWNNDWGLLGEKHMGILVSTSRHQGSESRSRHACRTCSDSLQVPLRLLSCSDLLSGAAGDCPFSTSEETTQEFWGGKNS